MPTTRRSNFRPDVLSLFLFSCIICCQTSNGLRGSAPVDARALAVSDYLERLPAAPIVAGFDVDDTALFSTPAFLYAKGRLIPEPHYDPRTSDADAFQAWVATLLVARESLFSRVVSAPRKESLTPYEQRQWVQFWFS